MFAPPFALLPLLFTLTSAWAAPLIRRQQNDSDPEAEAEATAEDSGHLDSRWIIVIAVVFSVVVLGVIAVVLWVKLRRQRRARGPVLIRSSSPYDCVRHSRASLASAAAVAAAASAKPSAKSVETITTPLPVVTYEKHRSSSSIPPPERARH